MKKEIRTIYYDEQLKLEAYYLGGIVQAFPNHFHDHYVIGLIDGGCRALHCKDQDYILLPGDIVVFMPGDPHGCSQYGKECLCYIGLNIPSNTMQEICFDITGKMELPCFAQNVIHHLDIASYIKKLHALIVSSAQDFQKEEMLYLLLSTLLEHYNAPFPLLEGCCKEEIQAACLFLEQHYTEKITLEQICQAANLSKSTLLSYLLKF